MKNVVLILLFSIKAYGQDTLYISTVAYDLGVSNYVIQSSTDSVNWKRVIQIQPQGNPGSNVYKIPIQKGFYYRAKANMIQGTYFTNTLAYFNISPNLNIYPSYFSNSLSP